MHIQQYIQWKHNKIIRNGKLLFDVEEQDCLNIPTAVYQRTGISYPKFFKMDVLSRVAFLAAELIVPPTEDVNKNDIATVISTSSGCLDVDKKFEESRGSHASPALFVYTLPNIMLGEICIRHGFKGEQICTLSERSDAAWTYFSVSDLLTRRGTEACLCGHVEATENSIEAFLFWVNKKEPTSTALPFTNKNLQHIFNAPLTS